MQIKNSKIKSSLQIEFADKIKADYSIIIGENEVKTNVLSVKNMQSGDQMGMDLADVKKLLCTVQ